MIRFGRIELAIYPNKLLIPSNGFQCKKRLLTRVRFSLAVPNHENLKKNLKKIRFVSIRFGTHYIPELHCIFIYYSNPVGIIFLALNLFQTYDKKF
jgi:hypothetical protein